MAITFHSSYVEVSAKEWSEMSPGHYFKEYRRQCISGLKWMFSSTYIVRLVYNNGKPLTQTYTCTHSHSELSTTVMTEEQDIHFCPFIFCHILMQIVCMFAPGILHYIVLHIVATSTNLLHAQFNCQLYYSNCCATRNYNSKIRFTGSLKP